MHRIAILLGLTFLLFLISPSASVHAQAGQICLFADPEGTTCTLDDSGPGLLQVHVIHMGAPGATAVSFMAPKPACMVGATWLGDDPGTNLVLGDSQTGVAVSYVSCMSSPYQVMTISYEVTGGTLPDCAYPVLPYPSKSAIEVVDCDNVKRYGVGSTTYINSSLPCTCGSEPLLSVSPTSLDFGSAATIRSVLVQDAGYGTLDWSIAESLPWLEVSPSSGTGDATVSVTVDRTGLGLGTYTGAIAVTSNAGDDTVNVSMTVSPPPSLSVSPASLDFGVTSVQKTLTISNTGGPGLTWTITPDDPWLSASPSTGTGDQQVTILADRAGLANGVHTDTLRVTSNGGDAAVPVTLTQQPVLGVTPTSLEFVNTATGTYTIRNDGTGTLSWSTTTSDPWVSVSPASGTGGAAVTVTIDTGALAFGNYTATVSVASNGGSQDVALSVYIGPELAVSPTHLDFTPLLTTGQFSITNVGPGTLEWSLAASEPWVSATPPSGTGDATITVAVSPDSLGYGTFNAAVAVTSNGGNQDVGVTFRRQAPPTGFGGVIAIYGDAAYTTCNVVDAGPSLQVLYVRHEMISCASASQFKLESHGYTGVWVSDDYLGNLAIGNSQTGLALNYGANQPLPWPLVNVTYMGSGTSPACSTVDVVPDPSVSAGVIEAVDCTQHLLHAAGAEATVNGNASCLCGLIATQPSSWSRIKGMYRPKPKPTPDGKK